MKCYFFRSRWTTKDGVTGRSSYYCRVRAACSCVHLPRVKIKAMSILRTILVSDIPDDVGNCDIGDFAQWLIVTMDYDKGYCQFTIAICVWPCGFSPRLRSIPGIMETNIIPDVTLRCKKTK